MKLTAFGCSLVLMAASSSAFAQGTSAQRAACTPDVFRLCFSEIPNVNGIVACLKAKKPQLSGECRIVMNGADKTVATASTRSIANAPEPDWCRFDPDISTTDAVWKGWCKR